MNYFVCFLTGNHLEFFHLHSFTIHFNSVCLTSYQHLKFYRGFEHHTVDELTVKMNESEKNNGRSSESPKETNEPTVEYPARLKLIMIVVALVLSMFLVCLSPEYFCIKIKNADS